MADQYRQRQTSERARQRDHQDHIDSRHGDPRPTIGAEQRWRNAFFHHQQSASGKIRQNGFNQVWFKRPVQAGCDDGLPNAYFNQA